MSLQLATICPKCNQKIDINKKHAVTASAPTGGDYEWVETDTSQKCAKCNYLLTLRLRCDIETALVLKVCATPKPVNQHITWYAWADVSDGFGNGKLVYVETLYQTKEEALQKPYKEDVYPFLKLLEVSAEGYRDANQNLIEEPSYVKSSISFR